jgi:hypothetical protein
MAEQKPKFSEDVPCMMGVSRTTGELRLLKLNDDGTQYVDIGDTGGTPYQFSGTATASVTTVSLGTTPANSWAIENTHSANTLYFNVTDAAPSAGTIWAGVKAGSNWSIDANIYQYSVKAGAGVTCTYQGACTKN